MIKYFCDRCGDEMDRSVVVTIGPERPVLDRNRPAGKTLDLCDVCGQELRAVSLKQVAKVPSRAEQLRIEAPLPTSIGAGALSVDPIGTGGR